MLKKIEELYLEISNLLIQNIDADESYTDPVDDYLMRTTSSFIFKYLNSI